MLLKRNILIHHMGALGDFIVTWPLALALGRIYAQSRIIYVTHSDKGKLAERVLRVESTDVESGKWHQLFSDSPSLSENASRMLAGAQMIFSFVSKPGDLWSRNVIDRTSASSIVHLDTNPETNDNRHITQVVLDQLSCLPPVAEAMRQMLKSIESRGVGFGRKPGTDVVIHPGAGSPAKCWPLERFVELIVQLKSQGRSVRLLLGEVERERWSTAILARIESLASVRHPAGYLELLDELSTAQVFIGNDSGPGHLAGIIGVPTVSIFGTDPGRWKPQGPQVTVVSASSIDRVAVEQVLQAALISH